MQNVTSNDEFMVRALKILKKSPKNWKNQKELSKVVHKIERKKKLKNKELLKVYTLFFEMNPIQRKR